MAHLTEYVKWRGDISFEERALNDIDNLVFCSLSFNISSNTTLSAIYTERTDIPYTVIHQQQNMILKFS